MLHISHIFTAISAYIRGGLSKLLPFVIDALKNTLKNTSPFNKIESITVRIIIAAGTNEIDYTRIQFFDNEVSPAKHVEMTCQNNQRIMFKSFIC